MPTDPDRGGLISTIVNKIDEVEQWIRGHKAFQHLSVAYTDTLYAPMPETSSGSAEFALDLAGKTTLIIASNATAIPTGGNNFSGMLLINEIVATGVIALFITGGGAVKFINESISGYFSDVKDTANKINVYWDGGTSRITIQNKRAVQITCVVAAIRTRTSQ